MIGSFNGVIVGSYIVVLVAVVVLGAGWKSINAILLGLISNELWRHQRTVFSRSSLSIEARLAIYALAVGLVVCVLCMEVRYTAHAKGEKLDC